jgi:hypothetical protein
MLSNFYQLHVVVIPTFAGDINWHKNVDEIIQKSGKGSLNN